MKIFPVAASLATTASMAAMETVGPPTVAVKTYDLKIPSAWQGRLAVSRFSISSTPFFGAPWDLAVSTCVRVSYGLTNLSGSTLRVLVNYRTEGKGHNTGTGGCYVLAPGQRRWIEAISPIADVQPSPRFILMVAPLDHPPTRSDLDRLPANRVLVLDSLPLDAFKIPGGVLETQATAGRPLHAAAVLLSGSAGTNTIIATVTNTSERPLEAALCVGVSHVDLPGGKPPKVASGGFFRREYATVSARGVTNLTVAYELPYAGPHPILAYQLMEARQGTPDAVALRKRDLSAVLAQTDADLLAWGAVDLTEAAKTGLCFLVPPAPVRDRANLTAQTSSPHFLFRYRPGSVAERDIRDIVAAREAVYARLSSLFDIQLPGPVQIDLYPDMEAKGLGSGTRINVANTISASHIAEVYNATTQVTPGHEIAHLFSYRFPSHPARGGEMGKSGDAFVEGFAGCFELEDSAETATARVRNHLADHKIPGLVELISSGSPAVSDEQVALVSFLIRKNPRIFKTFYAQVITRPDRETIDLASRAAYHMSVEDLEKEWRRSLEHH